MRILKKEAVMKVLELMTKDPIFCFPSNTVRQVARMMRDHDVVLIPVISQSGQLIGVVSDRDLCCKFIADGNDPDRDDHSTVHDWQSDYLSGRWRG